MSFHCKDLNNVKFISIHIHSLHLIVFVNNNDKTIFLYVNYIEITYHVEYDVHFELAYSITPLLLFLRPNI